MNLESSCGLFRDETDTRRTLGQIVEVFVLAAPLAVLLAALGGYFVARRSLLPVAAMAEHARMITSESLAERLPNPNPHDELGQLATVFNQTLQRLENSFAELKRFTADASHELRTPLTALRTVGEVALRQGDNPAVLRETIGSMLEEAQRLNDLMESLLTLARIEGGKVSIKPEAVKLAELAADVRDSLNVLASEKQQILEIAADDGVIATADRFCCAGIDERGSQRRALRPAANANNHPHHSPRTSGCHRDFRPRAGHRFRTSAEDFRPLLSRG
jgi:signal transduction histidine kinase